MTYDASNRKDIRRAEKESRQLTRQRGEVIIALMQTPAGRAYVWSELSSAHVFTTSFSTDPLQMAFTEGERNTGLRLIDTIMEWAADEFILMWREVSAREHSREQPRSADADGGDQGSDASGDDDRSGYDADDYTYGHDPRDN